MENEDEKWAIFWCDLLRPIIFKEIESEGIYQYLKMTAQKEVVFPNGRIGRPSLSTLRRKLVKFWEGGFNSLLRKPRADRGKPRNTSTEVIAKAIELKKEQPYRSDRTINRFLDEQFSTSIPRSTLYRHLKDAGATRLKLGVTKQKVRKRIVKDHTHALWIGDFEEGPYVIESDEVVPTYLAGMIDCYSRYVVAARYYLRQNLDILIDLFIRALAVHGAPRSLYLDNAKVFHSIGLKTACYKIPIRLIHRTEGDAAPGGGIERFFLTTQTQFEAEVRAGDILTLQGLNRAFSAWLNVAYHKDVHTDIGQAPERQYQKGLRAIRHVEVSEVLASFMQKIGRTVNRTFSDIQLNKRFYRVNPKFRGDRVEVRFDPFSSIDTVEIYNKRGEYLGIGQLHNRQSADYTQPEQPISKPKHNYLDLLVRQHQKDIDKQTKGIDYREVIDRRPWPFPEFAKKLADLLGRKGGLASFSADELEKLKKAYNRSVFIDKAMLKTAFENADQKSIPYIIHELKRIIKNKEGN